MVGSSPEVSRAGVPRGSVSREQRLESLRRKPDVSVLVLGAGVNGAGTFRDLALQGVDVLLVDRGDFCAGASAASSHMVHGGLRYLENGELRLVREAVRERNRLLVNAPHYVHPLATTIPIFRWVSGVFNAPLKFLGLLDRPAERGALVIKLGLLLYDRYAERCDHAVPSHRFSGRAESLERFPELSPEIICTATYYDAAMRLPERLCLEVVLDGEAEGEHARAINYLRFVGAESDTVHLRDEVTGDTYAVRPRIVVNAAGPWIDRTNAALGARTRFIGGTKGSHLVLDHPELREQLGGHEIFFENRDGRMVLLFPWMDRVLVGTTDIPVDEPDGARCTEDEVGYLLGMMADVFPKIGVDRSHIVYRFAGVRPLPASDARHPGQISRDHKYEILEPGRGLDVPVYCLIGGKWTTFRAFSEQVTDVVLTRLGRSRNASTETLSIGGGRGYPSGDEDRDAWVEAFAGEAGLTRDRAAELLGRYGTWVREVRQGWAEDSTSPLASQRGYTRSEIAFLARREHVVRLDDILLRRTPLAMRGVLTKETLEEVAEVVGETLGWTPKRRRLEVDRTSEILRVHHDVFLE